MNTECFEELRAIKNQLQSINTTLELISAQLSAVGLKDPKTIAAGLAEGLASLLASAHIPE